MLTEELRPMSSESVFPFLKPLSSDSFAFARPSSALFLFSKEPCSNAEFISTISSVKMIVHLLSFAKSFSSPRPLFSRFGLSPEQRKELPRALKARFEKNMNRHKGLEWDKVQAKLDANAEKLWSLNEMERTAGEPDVVGHDNWSPAQNCATTTYGTFSPTSNKY